MKGEGKLNEDWRLGPRKYTSWLAGLEEQGLKKK